MTPSITIRIEEFLKAYTSAWFFSGALLAARNGEILYEGAFGQASIEHQAPNTPLTRFRTYSITKSFTSLAMLVLQERGLVNMQDPLRKYFPSFDPRITLHHLATHTSGLYNYTLNADFRARLCKLPLSDDELMALFKDTPLNFEPGAQFSYCNSGYFLLGKIIEQVTGCTYARFLQENILEPAGMADSGVEDAHTILPRMASSYYLDGNDLIRAESIDPGFLQASGGLYSTVEDLLRWDRALAESKLVSPSSAKVLLTPFRENYSYGWNVDRRYNRQRMWHNGGFYGYLAEIHRYPRDGICAVALSNCGFTATGKLCDALAGLILGETVSAPARPAPARLPPGRAAEYVGEYEEPGTTLRVYNCGEDWGFVMDGKFRLPMYPVTDKVFHHTWIDEEYEFEKDERGDWTFWGTPRKRSWDS